MPLRVKLAIGAFAGVAAAWLIPKGGVAPPVSTPRTATPTTVTAVEEALTTVPAGVSFRTIDGVRIFLVRTGATVDGFLGLATTETGGPLYWCVPGTRFESSDGDTRYDRTGKALSGVARRDLDRLQVLVAAGRVTIFPHSIQRGAPSGRLAQPDASRCAANERVG